MSMTPVPTPGEDFMAAGEPGQDLAVEQVSDVETPDQWWQVIWSSQEGPGRCHRPRRLRARRDLRAVHRAPRPARRLLPATRRAQLDQLAGHDDERSGHRLAAHLRLADLVAGRPLRRALRDADRHGHRSHLGLRGGHPARRRALLRDQRLPRHPGLPPHHHARRLLGGARALAHRRCRVDHLLGRRGPRQARRRSSPCATATSSPRRSSPARARGASSSARSCRT